MSGCPWKKSSSRPVNSFLHDVIVGWLPRVVHDDRLKRDQSKTSDSTSTMKRSILLIAAYFIATAANAVEPTKPNLIVFYSDGHGYADLGIQGSENEQPGTGDVSRRWLQSSGSVSHRTIQRQPVFSLRGLSSATYSAGRTEILHRPFSRTNARTKTAGTGDDFGDG